MRDRRDFFALPGTTEIGPILVNPSLGGVTLGWNLSTAAEDRVLLGD